jgi:hypothetical protein
MWLSGTHHALFSLGFALQILGYRLINIIADPLYNPCFYPTLAVYRLYATAAIIVGERP